MPRTLHTRVAGFVEGIADVVVPMYKHMIMKIRCNEIFLAEDTTAVARDALPPTLLFEALVGAFI